MTDLNYDAHELLAWYADAGVDIALLDEPVDQFELAKAQSAAKVVAKPATASPQQRQDGSAKAAQTPPARPAPETSQRTIPDEETVKRARELAAGAKTLDELREIILGFEGCNLKFSAKSTVFADGNPQADLMLIGEAPGRDEDEQGLPFVGRSGQLLDKMLAAIGLDRTGAYISNVLPWRPPGNRNPTPMETEICRPFIERHVELAAPNLIILVGGSSAKTLLKTTTGIMSLRGRWAEIEIGGRRIPAMPTLHPAYLLRQPAQKRLVWQDLLAVKAKLADKPE